MLKSEILTDPLGRGYATMSDREVADRSNINDRPRNRTSMTASEVYNAIDQGEWTALSAAVRAEIWDILHLDEINPFGREAQRFASIFPNNGVTITALKAARVESISRAVELGLRSPMRPEYFKAVRS